MKKNTVYILLQTHEDEWGFRETDVLGVYTCMTKAKNALKKIRKEDFTGLFKENGFEYKEDTCSKSEYVDGRGFVSLYIVVEEVE